jgi:hypothetical protein
MEIAQWLRDVEVQLEKLRKKESLIYPNMILPPNESKSLDLLTGAFEEAIPPQILEFYTYCSGLELGEIHNGYWVFTIPFLLDGIKDGSFPTKITDQEGTYSVLTFGKDIGGSYLASCLGDSEEILYLRTGAVIEGVYDGEWNPVVHLADNFHEFLLRLLEDIKAYVDDTPDYEYMDHNLWS